MKFSVIASLIVAIAAGGQQLDSELNEHWEIFKKAFNKHYKANEEAGRRFIWERQVADIIKHNLQADMGLQSYRRGLNEFSDMTHKEFIKHFNGFRSYGAQMRNGSSWIEPINVEIPDSIDWREEGLVTPIKNQKQCSCCWAFSATGSLEGQHMKKTGKLVSLSEQNLVDCSRAEGNMGCENGLMDKAFEYVKENIGINTEVSYPYTAKDGAQCLFKKDAVGATCIGYVDLPSGDEDALKKAVATVGPISIAIDASQMSFQTYQSGIYNEQYCSSEMVDHAVLAVGYGTEDGTDYWLVKNSWGTTWGMKGYIKMSRNANNQCGIANLASYPLV